MYILYYTILYYILCILYYTLVYSAMNRDTSTLLCCSPRALHIAHALPPGKRERNISVHTLKKSTKWSIEVVGFIHLLPQNQLVHVKLTQEE